MRPPPTGRFLRTRRRPGSHGSATSRALGALLLVVVADPAAGAQQDPPWLPRAALDSPLVTHRLPRRLRELSGLAVTDDGRLLAHDDERAVVYEVDPRDGELIKGFGLGDPVARADFEGIAVARGRVYLVTSGGTIYETREGRDDERMLFNTYGTGLGRRCEVEGLEFDPAHEALLLACKNPRDDALEGSVAIFLWSFATRELEPDPILIDAGALAESIEEPRFQPSGIVRNADTGTWLLVAGPQSAIAEVTPSGDVVAVRRMDADRHPQPEGIAILPDGRVAIGDEGGSGRGRVTIYGARPLAPGPPDRTPRSGSGSRP